MQSLKSKWVLLMALSLCGAALLTGCSGGSGQQETPAGPDAGKGGDYKPEDAAAAQPKRGDVPRAERGEGG